MAFSGTARIDQVHSNGLEGMMERDMLHREEKENREPTKYLARSGPAWCPPRSQMCGDGPSRSGERLTMVNQSVRRRKRVILKSSLRTGLCFKDLLKGHGE